MLQSLTVLKNVNREVLGCIALEQVPAIAVATEDGVKDLREAVLSEKESQPGINSRQHAINIYRKYGDRLAADIVAILQKSERLEKQAASRLLIDWFENARSACREIAGMDNGYVFATDNRLDCAVCVGKATELSKLSLKELQLSSDAKLITQNSQNLVSYRWLLLRSAYVGPQAS